MKKLKKGIERFEKNGNSLVLTAVDGELKALMGVRDQIRPGVKQDLQKLKKTWRKKTLLSFPGIIKGRLI